MTVERTRHTAHGPDQRGGQGDVKSGGGKVAVTVRINRDTFELLQNVALGHEFSKVAAASRGDRVSHRDRYQSVAAVIERLIERHRDALEAEDRLSLDHRGKNAGPADQKGR
jgi:hypothetical protein